MVLEAVLNGRAEAIVTFNARDFAGLADEFGLALLAPNAILGVMAVDDILPSQFWRLSCLRPCEGQVGPIAVQRR
jgi:hypothetical protein